MGTGGYIRSASSRHASRYGSALTLTKSISSSDLKAVRISAVNLSKANLFVNKRNVTPERSVAVVSDPPMTRMPLLAWRLSRVSPYCPSLASQPHTSKEGCCWPLTHSSFFFNSPSTKSGLSLPLSILLLSFALVISMCSIRSSIIFFGARANNSFIKIG